MASKRYKSIILVNEFELQKFERLPGEPIEKIKERAIRDFFHSIPIEKLEELVNIRILDDDLSKAESSGEYEEKMEMVHYRKKFKIKISI